MIRARQDINRQNRATKQKGFTLLELLVVISIIGILLAVGIASFTAAQKKGRDARRQGDIKAMQTAFEQYYSEHGNYADSCDIMATANMVGGVMPSDPAPSKTYTCVSSATTSDFCVCAELDDVAGGNSGSAATTTTCDYGGGTTYYCMSNQQ